MNTVQIMLRCSLLAKKLAPKDTGNLAFNSIRAYKTPNGFRIVQLGNAAPYGSIINTGRGDRPLTQKEQDNVGWWNQDVYLGVKNYLNTNLNFDQKSYQEVARQSKNTIARDKVFARSIPKG